MIMKELLTALICVSLLLVTGCFLGDTFAHKTIALSIPATDQQTNVSLSVNDIQVQEALKLIDSVLVANGYVRDPNPLTAVDEARGLIVFYGVCGVTLQGHKLEVGFVEAHTRHFSSPVKKVIQQLQDKLRSQYGNERVKIED
jgi:hypothetical protein